MGKNIKMNNGFSLIELMIVVAIIGTLSSIAVPTFLEYANNARRTQAKTCLSGLYTANQSFFAEWSQYFGNWDNIGYKTEGNVYYRCGFWASAGGASPPVPKGYTGPGQQSGTSNGHVNTNNSLGICGTGSHPCREVDNKVCGLQGVHRWGNDWFNLGACGRVTHADGTVRNENWSMNEYKKMRKSLVP